MIISDLDFENHLNKIIRFFSFNKAIFKAIFFIFETNKVKGD